MSKITIIGSGRVGSTIAYSLTCREMATEIVIIDVNGEKALGEALDIRQGLAYGSPCLVYAGNYEDAKDSDIVVITSGIARQPGQSRLDLINTNINIQKAIIPEITKRAPNAIYIIVSNPVDVLTYTFTKLSGIPENHIIGSGTVIDTARLRARLTEYCGLDARNINAYVFGEHGDSSFIPWSISKIAEVPIAEYNNALCVTPIDEAAIEKYIKSSGAVIIQRKGATYYAIASTVSHICNAIIRDSRTAMTVSTLMHGEYGVDDVCLSTLKIVGKDGILAGINTPLNEEEVEKLKNSARVLRGIIDKITL